MQKRIPALVLAAVMLITMFTGLAANAPAFNDLAGHWSEPMVTELATRGIIQGMPDGNVHPDKLVTRGEFACLVARILEMHDHTPGDPSFNDTYEHWSHQYIEALVSIGVVDSTGSLYRPEDPITRVEMTRILVAAIDRGEHAVANASSTDFKDDHLISADDKGYINIARLYKLVEGYPSNYFNPHGLSTRAEAFTIISRYDAALEIVQREGNQMAVAPDTDTVSGADSGSDTKSGTGSATKPAQPPSNPWINVPVIPTPPSTNPTPSPEPQLPEPPPINTVNTIMMPKVLYTDIVFPLNLELESSNLTVDWSLERNDLDVTLSDYIEGTLGDNGGTIRFMETGEYTLTVTVTDITSREFSASASTTVYPIIGSEIGLPESGEADDEDGSFEIILEDTEDLEIEWSLTRNGEEVTLSDYIEGALDKTGGNIRFKVRGEYVLTAHVTDSTGRKHLVSSTITFYPVPSFEITIPAQMYSDEEIEITTGLTHMDDLTIVWSLTKDGSPVTLGDYIEGTLDNDGGSIKFIQDGEYVLTATVTDELDRTTNASGTFTVSPPADITFILPDYLHTDDTHALTTTLENADGLDIQWKLKRDGSDVAFGDFIEGTLTGDGGSIRFKQKGVYELIAVITDASDREIEVSGTITVYPVLVIDFDLPETMYPDGSTTITVQVTEE